MLLKLTLMLDEGMDDVNANDDDDAGGCDDEDTAVVDTAAADL